MCINWKLFYYKKLSNTYWLNFWKSWILKYIKNILYVYIYIINMNHEQIEQLLEVKSASNGTSMLTIYIPPKTNLWLVCEMLDQELNSVNNIKSKSVKKDAKQANKMANNYLKAQKNNFAPNNGYVLIAGIIAPNEYYA